MMARKILWAAVLVTSTVWGATNEYTVAAGDTKTFAQMESELGITLAAGDAIVKKGPGVLQVTTDAKYQIKYTMIVEEGVFHVPNGVTNDKAGTVTVKKGACLWLQNTSVSFKSWTFNLAGNGTGVAPYLGAVVVAATGNNGQTNHGTWNLDDDTTIYTYLNGKTAVNNYIFSGSSNKSGPKVNMNNHTLTVKGDGMATMFRPRWQLVLRTTGTFLVDHIFYARHADAASTMDDYDPCIPLFKLVNGSRVSVDGYYAAKVNAFDFEYGTSLGKTGAGGGVANTQLKKIIGCPEITADATIGCSDAFVVRAADLAAGHALTSVNAFTFGSDCQLSVEGLTPDLLVSGTSYPVATAEAGIVGTPALTGETADYFELETSADGKTLSLKVNPGFQNAQTLGLLPDEENAAHNTAALAAFAAAITDGNKVFFPAGDYFFDGDFDLSSFTGKDVLFCTLDGSAAIHATLKVGAAENLKLSKLVFKGCEGPAIVAEGMKGLTVADCTLDDVAGAYTDGKKYPFVVKNVTDFEVTNPTYPFKTYLWDGTAYFEGGSQTAASRVRAGEFVCYVDDTMSEGTAGWVGWTYVTNRSGLAASAYKGLKIRKTGNGTLDPNITLAEIGIEGVEVVAGQYVTRGNAHLGVAKKDIYVRDGACLCIAGSGEAIKERTVHFTGTGISADKPAIRFTSNSAWNKASSVTWELDGDATMYDNVANAGNGNFLWSTFKMNGHTLTLTGKTGGVYRFGRSCAWNGGGTLIADKVTVSASANADAATKPSTTAYRVVDGSSPKFIFRNGAKFTPDTCELAYLMGDIDFQTTNCQMSAKSGANIPHDFVFKAFAGAPAIADVIKSITVNRYTAHAADLKKDPPSVLTMAGAFTFADGASVAVDDPASLGKPHETLLIEAAGGVTGKKPTVAAETAELGWHALRKGNGLYLGLPAGVSIFVR